MRSRIALLLVLLLLTSSRGLEAQADAAWSVAGLEAVREFTDSIGTAAFLLVSNGTVVASWGDVSRPLRAHSIRKSLLSALIGVALERGELDLDTTLDGLGINDRELLTDLERSATTLQLLQSRSGVYHPAASETAEARSTRPRRGSHAPGSHWYYNNWDFNALGTIYASARGQTVGDAFRDWIARPLGMQDYDEDRDFATSWSRTSPDIPPTSSDCLPGTWPGSVSSFFSGGSGTVRPWSPRPGSPRAPGSTRTRTSPARRAGTDSCGGSSPPTAPKFPRAVSPPADREVSD